MDDEVPHAAPSIPPSGRRPPAAARAHCSARPRPYRTDLVYPEPHVQGSASPPRTLGPMSLPIRNAVA